MVAEAGLRNPIPLPLQRASVALPTVHSALRRASLALLGELSTVFASFLDVNEAYYDHGGGADSKQERKSHPVVLGFVDDRLDHIWPDDGRLEGK
jgi:hypothetical protein